MKSFALACHTSRTAMDRSVAWDSLTSAAVPYRSSKCLHSSVLASVPVAASAGSSAAACDTNVVPAVPADVLIAATPTCSLLIHSYSPRCSEE